MNKEELKQMSNGFLDIMRFFCVTNYQNGYIKLGINNKIYRYTLYEYKSAFNDLTEEKNRQLYYSEFLDYLNKHFISDKKETDMEKYLEYIKEEEEKERQRINALKEYKAEFENALDVLYFGYGYKFWREHNNTITNEKVAEIVWKEAINKMSKD